MNSVAWKVVLTVALMVSSTAVQLVVVMAEQMAQNSVANLAAMMVGHLAGHWAQKTAAWKVARLAMSWVGMKDRYLAGWKARWWADCWAECLVSTTAELTEKRMAAPTALMMADQMVERKEHWMVVLLVRNLAVTMAAKTAGHLGHRTVDNLE